MKLLLLAVLALTISSVVALPLPLLAQPTDLEGSIQDRLNPIQDVYDPQAEIHPGTLQETIAKIIRQVLGLLGIIFLILIIYAGLTWMTAAGDEGKIDRAKKIISAAIVGLAIVLAAYAITYFVATSLLQATVENN